MSLSVGLFFEFKSQHGFAPPSLTITQVNPMRDNDAPKPILRDEYRPFEYRINHVSLTFELDSDATTVASELHIEPAETFESGEPAGSIFLDGVDLELIDVHLNGESLDASKYKKTDTGLQVEGITDASVLGITTRINPAANVALEGLYQSSGNFCTQCEAQGFRKITFYPDRPDVLATFDVTLIADKTRYPVLLANGNLADSGDKDDGRHWARWRDPFPKPSYLFALVAGDLEHVQDTYTTSGGRQVDLRIYVESHNLSQVDYAMDALKRSMKWDEEVFKLEYDLDIFMIVAVDDFNMGAMENKGLNIFNSRYVLAKPETATDADISGVESVIAHEYFHNWTGNRITCRDWFQLSLKEGLTVFRDQEFSSDINSRAVKRIADVRLLKSRQFPEDAGPMAHPIRPDSYIEINNFYTVTVYEKGAEVIRMMHTLLGADGFHNGMALYVERHDGMAATCEDFILAMEQGAAVELAQFRRWYSQAGTPTLSISSEYDAQTQRYQLKVEQDCLPTPGQDKKLPFHIPLRIGLLGKQGDVLPLQLNDGDGQSLEVANELVLDIKQSTQVFEFENVAEQPVPSLLRQFSAPVNLHCNYSDDDLALLMSHDSDTFNRWDSSQRLFCRVVELVTKAGTSSWQDHTSVAVMLEAFSVCLADNKMDPALKAEIFTFPGIEAIADSQTDAVGNTLQLIDVELLHNARQSVLRLLAVSLHEPLLQQYQELHVAQAGEYLLDAASMGKRSLKNTCLQLLSNADQEDAVDAWQTLAEKQYQGANNMTDRVASLKVLCSNKSAARERVLADFYQRFENEKLVIDKWFSLQAQSTAVDVVDQVDSLRNHPAFNLLNPNRVRSLIGVFAMTNPVGFHQADGRGYQLLTETISSLDHHNPQVAARLASVFTRWRRFDVGRQKLMKQSLQQLAAIDILSPDVYEIVSKSLDSSQDAMT